MSYTDSPILIPYFTIFVLVWLYLRHYLNIIILYATLTTFKTVGSFDLNWDTQQYKCWISQYITFGLLTSLQCLNLFWLYFVLRIAYNMAFKHVVQDDRSDDEDDSTDDEAMVDEKPSEKKTLENARPNGIRNRVNGVGRVNETKRLDTTDGINANNGLNGANGHALEGSDMQMNGVNGINGYAPEGSDSQVNGVNGINGLVSDGHGTEVNGVNGMNGHVSEDSGVHVNGILEGKKER